MKIDVNKKSEDIYDVRVDGSEYEVELDNDYYEKLARGRSPEELIKNSFEFLLEWESKESILKKFNLREISRYFPEYEKIVGGE